VRAPDLSSPQTRSMLAIVAGGAAALAVPAMMGAAQVQGLASTIVLAMSLLSLNVLLGYTGQISLGHAAFVGAGGFAAINVAGRLSLESAGPAGRIVELLLAAVVAGVAIGLLTTLIGLPALRIKGLQVAIATLAFGAAAQTYLFTQPWFTGGGSGLSVDPLFGRGEVYRFYVVAVLTLGLLVVVDRRLLGTQLGRAFVAVRDGEDRAAAFGVDAGVSKLRAYAVSGVFAGVAGAFSVHISGSVEGIDLIVINSLVLLSYVVLGGIGSRAGILAVAFLLIAPQTVGLFDAVPIVNSIFTPKFIQLISGLLLIVIVIFLPTGYGGLLDDQKRLWRRLPVAARAGVVSVVAVVVGMQLVREQGFRSAEIFDGTRAPAFALVFALLALAAALAGYLALLYTDTGDVAVAEVGGALAVGGEAGDRARQAAGAARELRNVPRAVSLRMPTRVLLESRNVTMRFGSVTAIDDLTLEVREGEIVGLIGANGAGKSTFFNCVSGFITPQEGSIRYRGQELITAKPSSRTKLGIGRTFQHMGLMRPETVGDNVLLAQHWLADYDGFAGMLGLAGSIQTERQLRQRAQAALRIFGLEHLRDVRLGSLPYGTMRMVELASTVASGADLLFFDEASAGLGPDEAHALGDRFHALRDELGLSLVVIEHHVPLIARTCDHVYCLASGRMLAHGRPSEVQSNAEVIAEFLGRSQIGEDGEAVIGKIGHDDAGMPDFTPDITLDITSQVRT
jgi:branched-chain amino acid transport system ATP-binding protein